MARPTTFTFEQLSDAAQQLRSQGIEPSTRKVQEVMGCGSRNKVNELLQQWFQENPPPSQKKRETAINVLAAMSDVPAPIEVILPGLIPGTVGAIVSPGGAGKSALALQLCAQLAGGPDLLGLGALPVGRVVYLPAEDPAIVIEHRLFALGEHTSPEARQRIASNLEIVPLETRKPDLLNSRTEQWLMQKAEGAQVMVLDTLRMFHSAEENDGGQMSNVIAVMKRVAAATGCTVLFIHHTSKSAAMSGSGDVQQASRGSSVLVDNIRWQAYLVTMTKEIAKQMKVPEDTRWRFVQFGTSKCNYGSGIEEHWLERVSSENPDVAAGYVLRKKVWPTDIGPSHRAPKGGRKS